VASSGSRPEANAAVAQTVHSAFLSGTPYLFTVDVAREEIVHGQLARVRGTGT